MFSLLIFELIGAILQLLIFACIPFLCWLFSARKKQSFFLWIGLKKPVTQKSIPNTILITHMSDLHFSSNPSKQIEKNSIIDELIQELKSLKSEWQPTIVCISGDIVDKYDINAYPIAAKQLRKIASALNIPTSHFLFTPGNHDCSRDEMQYPCLDNIDDARADSLLQSVIPDYIRGRFNFYMEKLGNDSVINGHHAWNLAKQVNAVLEKRTLEQKRCTLHVFYAGPWSVLFNLGRLSRSYGKVQLYEYDMEHARYDSYYKTVHFPLEGDR